MKYYVCEEHVDLALEYLIDEFERAPVLEKFTGEGDLSPTCEYCGEKSAYIVGNIDSDTK
jgi:CxxH/CxxC protein (TIGR04129 family)